MSSESSKNWIVIAEFSGSVYAEMAENILIDNDIPCYTKGDFLSTAYSISAMTLPGGSVKLSEPLKADRPPKGQAKRDKKAAKAAKSAASVANTASTEDAS